MQLEMRFVTVRSEKWDTLENLMQFDAVLRLHFHRITVTKNITAYHFKNVAK